MRRSKPRPRTVELSPAFARLVRALAREVEHDRDSARRSDAKALAALGRLVTVTMAAHGILEPTDDLRDAIDRIARKHLRRAGAEQRLQHALSRVRSVAKRDAIDTAHVQLLDLGERAYYYAGLAAGVLFADRIRG